MGYETDPLNPFIDEEDTGGEEEEEEEEGEEGGEEGDDLGYDDSDLERE